MRRILKQIALAVALVMLLSGCRLWLPEFGPVAFADMEYVRPDLSQLDTLAQQCGEKAKGDDVDEFMDVFYDFYDLYIDFSTASQLVYIYYCMDMTDLYWEKEYNYCQEQSATVNSTYENLLYALAESPLRQELESEEYFGEGFFDDYDGNSLWTEEFTALMDEESRLQSEYYQISAKMADFEYYSEEFYEQCAQPLSELYVEMIALRQEIAREAGFESYAEFAYDFYYDRDYTPQQAEEYIGQICRELTPLYLNMDIESYMAIAQKACTEQQTMDYVRVLAESMDGTVKEAFGCMDELGLYHISPGENKPEISYEAYIPGYYSPFVFMNPYGTVVDKLTFAHEFGHFCNDYASYGTSVGIDVAEIFSQGMEYLSLCYVVSGEELAYLKMVDSLCVFVEQTAYASFEHQAYRLTGDELTAENVGKLFMQVCQDYGWDEWGNTELDYVTVSHFFISPMYVISYAVSNDAAMQLYQMEQEAYGSGLACYEAQLDTEEGQLLAFLKEAGLESPFAEGRVSSLKATFSEILDTAGDRAA